MSDIYNELLIVGAAIFAGLVAARVFDRIGIPEIIGMILVGLLLGPSTLGILTPEHSPLYKQVIDLALAFIGFFIGAELRIDELRNLGKNILYILFFEVVVVFIVVFTGIYAVTNEWVLAIFLASISVSTAPAATADVIWEHRAKGPLSTTILALIGFDDVVAILVYTLATLYAFQAMGIASIEGDSLSYFISYLGYSVLIGVILGGIVILLGSILKKRRDIILLTIGVVIFNSGLVELLNGSELISALIIGFIYENYFKESPLSIDLLRELTAPLFTLFFVIIGSRLSLAGLGEIGIIGLVYIACSLIGKATGSKIGAITSGAEEKTRKYIGFTLFTQGGVALGLAHLLYFELVKAGPEFIALANKVVNITTTGVLILLVVGPLSLRYALIKAGEAYKITREELVFED